MDAMILAGGLGTRLRTIWPNRQKCLIEVDDQPFLTHKLHQLREFGIHRAILCLGYEAQELIDHYKAHPIEGLELVFSVEPTPLGTAGALKWAMPHAQTEQVLVFNGDCYLDLDLHHFQSLFHRSLQAAGLIAVAPTPADAQHYGQVHWHYPSYRILRFSEKTSPMTHDTLNTGISAGVYCLRRAVLNSIPANTAYSLEYDVFPALVARSSLFSFDAQDAYFVDIGTPNRFQQMRQDIRQGRIALSS